MTINNHNGDINITETVFANIVGHVANGCYGVVFDMLPEVELVHLAPFTGFQMFYGEPEPHLISFMQVIGIEKMYDYIVSKGWDKITEIVVQPWGGKTCSLTTIDGYIINIFE